MNLTVSPQDVRASLDILSAVALALKTLGTVPDGEFYARVCGHVSHEQYEAIIATLIRTKFISRDNHVISWKGEA